MDPAVQQIAQQTILLFAECVFVLFKNAVIFQKRADGIKGGENGAEPFKSFPVCRFIGTHSGVENIVVALLPEWFIVFGVKTHQRTETEIFRHDVITRWQCFRRFAENIVRDHFSNDVPTVFPVNKCPFKNFIAEQRSFCRVDIPFRTFGKTGLFAVFHTDIKLKMHHVCTGPDRFFVCRTGNVRR